MVDGARQPIEVFFSYSREDKPLRDKLDVHLSSLKRQGVISAWHDRQIIAGSEWEEEIDRHMHTADVILLLISPDFVNSEYCYDIELPVAMARHEAGEACVVPILLRPVLGWKNLPFAKLQVYPSEGRPITKWRNEDDAFVDVGEGILAAISQVLAKREQERQEQERQERERQEQEKLRQEQEPVTSVKLPVKAPQCDQKDKKPQREKLLQQEVSEEREKFEATISRQEREQIVWSRRQLLLSSTLGFGSLAFGLLVYLRPSGAERSPRSQPNNLTTPPTPSSPTQSPQPSSISSSTTSLKPFNFEVVTVNAKGEENPRQRKQGQLFVEDLGNGVTLEMVSIPSGTFQMGSPTTEKARQDDESPQYPVNVSAFSIGRYAVTQAQYQAIMGKNPSYFKGVKRPVEQVSWNDAQEFCKKLSQKTGHKYRLPSEAEWEYACRAGTATPFHFGETITTDLANYRGTDWEFLGTNYPGNYGEAPKGKYRERTTDVGIFPANAFGLCDMHGNVWEWCEDIYYENYEGASKDRSAWNIGGEASRRLLRGGSWDDFPAFCRSAVRSLTMPVISGYVIGFRVVCSFANA
jgi:formylglycine-generating enzyme required for sulfatase activity